MKPLNTDFSNFPVLETQRLLLRQVVHEDAPVIFRLRSDKDVMRYLDRPAAKTIEDAHELINRIDRSLENQDGITWGIMLKSGGDLIGTAGHWRIMKEHFRSEIGYMLDPQWQGKGLMQEVLEKVLDYGFNTLGLHSVEANVNPGNSASIRLLERNNFVREAYFRENYFYDGKFLDTLIYSKLAIRAAM